MDDSKRRLLWHGMFLFLLGLCTGLADPLFANTRMGLAAHLEGAMNGSPITAPGLSAQPWQESLVTAGFVTVGIAIIAATVLILWGLRRDAR